MTIMYVYPPLLSTKSWLRKLIRRKAFELNASGLIFVHNHPSGDLKPSQHDLSLREKLNKACRAVDPTPLDHLIIGPAGYISFKEKGLSEMLVLLPPPPEQKKIAKILITLDDAIEKTTQIIERTKELKKGLMQRPVNKQKKLMESCIQWMTTSFRISRVGKIGKGQK